MTFMLGVQNAPAVGWLAVTCRRGALRQHRCCRCCKSVNRIGGYESARAVEYSVINLGPEGGGTTVLNQRDQAA